MKELEDSLEMDELNLRESWKNELKRPFGMDEIWKIIFESDRDPRSKYFFT